MCSFSLDYRTVQDRRGVVLRLSPVQAEILAYMDSLGRSCSHTELRDHLRSIGRSTESIKHAFYAADGKRIWGALIVPVADVRGHIQLDRSFAARPASRRKPLRSPRKPRRPNVGDLFAHLAAAGQ